MENNNEFGLGLGQAPELSEAEIEAQLGSVSRRVHNRRRRQTFAGAAVVMALVVSVGVAASLRSNGKGEQVANRSTATTEATTATTAKPTEILAPNPGIRNSDTKSLEGKTLAQLESRFGDKSGNSYYEQFTHLDKDHKFTMVFIGQNEEKVKQVLIVQNLKQADTVPANQYDISAESKVLRAYELPKTAPYSYAVGAIQRNGEPVDGQLAEIATENGSVTKVNHAWKVNLDNFELEGVSTDGLSVSLAG